MCMFVYAYVCMCMRVYVYIPIVDKMGEFRLSKSINSHFSHWDFVLALAKKWSASQNDEGGKPIASLTPFAVSSC